MTSDPNPGSDGWVVTGQGCAPTQTSFPHITLQNFVFLRLKGGFEAGAVAAATG